MTTDETFRTQLEQAGI
ncbi:hypothetical protein [Nostoc flagelliforme]